MPIRDFSHYKALFGLATALFALITGTTVPGCKAENVGTSGEGPPRTGPVGPYQCDDFNGKVCVEKPSSNHVYRFKIPERRAQTWRDLGNYMYFHAAATPGVRVEFGRKLGPEERAALKQSLHCEYVLEQDGRSYTGALEGNRIDEDGGGFWCFEYLGAMLTAFHKKHGTNDSRPSRNFFPATLRLRYGSVPKGTTGHPTRPPLLAGEIILLVRAEWEIE